MNIQEFIGVFFELFALIISFLFVKYANKSFTILFFYLFLTFTIELIGNILKIKHINNIWLYEIYLLFDCTIQLFFIVRHFQSNRLLKKILTLVGFIFIALWFYFLIYKKQFGLFSKPIFISDFTINIFVYFTALYLEAVNEKTKILHSPFFWSCIASIIFYGTSITYFSAFDILTEGLTNKQTTILYYVVVILPIIIRNLLVSYTFLLFYINRNKSLNAHN